MKVRNKNNKGFTLIEVLAALAIMGMTIVFIGGVYTALNASSVNKESINAQGLAKSQMESIMKADYIMSSEYIPGDLEKSYETISIPAELIAQGYEIYIAPPQDVPNSNENIQKIMVEVRISEEEETRIIFKLVNYKLNNVQE